MATHQPSQQTRARHADAEVIEHALNETGDNVVGLIAHATQRAQGIGELFFSRKDELLADKDRRGNDFRDVHRDSLGLEF